MKTFFEKLLIQFEFISHPAGGWFSKSTRKRKSSKELSHTVLSPECYNVRGVSSKKQNFNRHTPAP
jgi:predicted cupin superfamily sugar epimerase